MLPSIHDTEWQSHKTQTRYLTVLMFTCPPNFWGFALGQESALLKLNLLTPASKFTPASVLLFSKVPSSVISHALVGPSVPVELFWGRDLNFWIWIIAPHKLTQWPTHYHLLKAQAQIVYSTDIALCYNPRCVNFGNLSALLEPNLPILVPSMTP